MGLGQGMPSVLPIGCLPAAGYAGTVLPSTVGPAYFAGTLAAVAVRRGRGGAIS